MGEIANLHPARAAMLSSPGEATVTVIRALVVTAALAYSTGGFAGPVHEAARDGDLTRVEPLIEKDPKLVHSQDDHHFTPLHWAAANGHTGVTKSLLNHGADPDARTDLGMTPLLLVKDCRKDLIVFLADHGADVRARGDNGWTALHWAAQRLSG